MAVRIPLELATIMGTDDPVAVWQKWFREVTAPTRAVLARAVERLGRDEYVATDADDPRKKHRIKLKPGSSSGPDETALKFAIVASKFRNGPALLADEARCVALGMPRGPSAKSYDGLDDPTGEADKVETITDEDWRTLGTATAGGAITAMRRSFDAEPDAELRHFEPITMAAVGAIAIPILVAIVPVVLPMVLDAGRRFIENLAASGGDVGKAVQDTASGKSTADEAKAAALAAQRAEEEKRQMMIRVGAVVAAIVVVVVVVVVVKAKKGAA